MRRIAITDATLAKKLEQVEILIDLQFTGNQRAAEMILGRLRTVRAELEHRAETLLRVRARRARLYGR